MEEEEEDSVVGELGEEDHPAVPTWWTSRCIGVVRTSAKVLAHGLYHRRRRRLLLLLEGLRRYCRCRYDGVAFRRKTQSPTRPPPSISKALPAPQPPSDCATDGSETKKEEPCPAAWLQGVGRSRGWVCVCVCVCAGVCTYVGMSGRCSQGRLSVALLCTSPPSDGGRGRGWGGDGWGRTRHHSDHQKRGPIIVGLFVDPSGKKKGRRRHLGLRGKRRVSPRTHTGRRAPMDVHWNDCFPLYGVGGYFLTSSQVHWLFKS